MTVPPPSTGHIRMFYPFFRCRINMPALTFRVCNPISPARFLFAHFDSFFPFQRGADSILLPFSLVIYIKLSFSKDLLGARYFLLRRGWAANHSARLASARSRARSL